jgi:hypothetical protein
MKIDTSTTAGKIAVQQAWIEGKVIKYKCFKSEITRTLSKNRQPMWAWDKNRYFIVPQTAKEGFEELYRNMENLEYHKFFEGGVEWQKEQDQ